MTFLHGLLLTRPGGRFSREPSRLSLGDATQPRSEIIRDAPHGAGGPVPIPTNEEIDEAIRSDHEIVAAAAKQIGQLTYLKFAFHSGDTSTVSMGPGSIGAFRLFRGSKDTLSKTLRASLIWRDSRRETPQTGLEIQSGHMSG